MDNDKIAFFEKYKACADEYALEKIWVAKISEDKAITFTEEMLGIAFTRELNDLSPLIELENLQYLSIGGTQVSDLSPLKGLVHLYHLDVSYTQVSEIGRAHV